MAIQVHCDQFRAEQFVPAHQVRTMLSVYIARREERSANQGLGCAVKDLFSGEEQKLKISALIKMGVRFPNGKKVKAYKLRGGETYTLLGTPTQQNCGVFIVPKGDKYEYLYNGQPLAPGACIVWNGTQSRVIGYRLFRKLFIMSPNPISAGKMKSSVAQPFGGMVQQPQFGTVQQGFGPTGFPKPPAGVAPSGFSQQFQNPMPQQPIAQPSYQATQNFGFGQAQYQTQHNSKHQLTAVCRVLRNGDLTALILSDGMYQAQVPIEQCIAYAERGELKNIKAVKRNGTKFLSGVGMSLESLPYILG